MRVKKVTYFEVSDTEFDEFVSEVYGHNFEFVPTVECGNDSEHSYSAIDRELNQFDRRDLDKWINGEGYYVSVNSIFDDLARRKLIEPGNYLIRVSW